MTCCFFGHKDASNDIAEDLRNAILQAIQDGADSFLLGNQGSFDRMAYRLLKALQQQYPQIHYNVVLAYMPATRAEYGDYAPTETLYPEGLETVPQRFAISWRNNWMLKQSDMAICYVLHSWGGAAQFYEKAQRR